MSARSFLDTNVLVYTHDEDAPAKQRRALELVAEHRRAGTGVVSLQVLQEYFATVTRKLGVDAAVARRKVELLAELDVVVPDVADVLGAIDLHRLHGFSFWDALVVRAAKQAGCSVLLSEDLQDRREVDGVRIVNPFLGAAVHEKGASNRPDARERAPGGGPRKRRRAR
jgi:predicted nucleic acid-binding protein